MRRPLMSRRRRQDDGKLVVGGLLVLGGIIILFKMLPVWAFWLVVAICCIACGLALITY